MCVGESGISSLSANHTYKRLRADPSFVSLSIDAILVGGIFRPSGRELEQVKRDHGLNNT